jgi:EAL domain-containing protein (putative c-di-GMP-specific phosphodiesterase class I)
VLDDPNADIMGILGELRARDIHVELDDFGTGYASLSHLTTMPINGLKIDKSFVSDMDNNQKQRSIVSALISMSKLMQLRVVCEGIETKQQLEAVSQIGNCSIQGYFIAKPMSFDDMTNWIRAKRNIGALKTLPEVAVING